MNENEGFYSINKRRKKHKSILRKYLSSRANREIFDFEMTAVYIFLIGVACLLLIFCPYGNKTGESFLISIGTGLIAGDVLLLVGGKKSRELYDLQNDMEVNRKCHDALNALVCNRHKMHNKEEIREKDPNIDMKMYDYIVAFFQFRNSVLHDEKCVQTMLLLNEEINQKNLCMPNTSKIDFEDMNLQVYDIYYEVIDAKELTHEVLTHAFNQLELYYIQLEKLARLMNTEYLNQREAMENIERNYLG